MMAEEEMAIALRARGVQVEKSPCGSWAICADGKRWVAEKSLLDAHVVR